MCDPIYCEITSVNTSKMMIFKVKHRKITFSVILTVSQRGYHHNGDRATRRAHIVNTHLGLSEKTYDCSVHHLITRLYGHFHRPATDLQI